MDKRKMTRPEGDVVGYTVVVKGPTGAVVTAIPKVSAGFLTRSSAVKVARGEGKVVSETTRNVFIREYIRARSGAVVCAEFRWSKRNNDISCKFRMTIAGGEE